MKYYENSFACTYCLSIVLSPDEICCLEPFVVQSLLRHGGRSINLWLNHNGNLHIDAFFLDYESRKNFCQLLDGCIKSK